MKARIRKKILTRKGHPKHASEAARLLRRVEMYARGECVRMGLNPDLWGSYALRWRTPLNRWIYCLRMAG